jgi:hypothetical protein
LKALKYMSHEPTEWIAIHCIMLHPSKYICPLIRLQKDIHEGFTLLQSLVKSSRMIFMAPHVHVRSIETIVCVSEPNLWELERT